MTRRQYEPTPGNARPRPSETSEAPLLLPAAAASRLCGRSPASWWRDHAAGRIPAPVNLGGRTLWRREELYRWIEAGCPSREDWERLELTRR